MEVKISPNCSQMEIERIFTLQNQAKNEVKNADSKTRVKKLRSLMKAILKERNSIQQAIFNDFRKAAEEVDITEIYPIVSEIRHTIKNLDRWMMQEDVETPLSLLGSSSYILKEAKGQALIISPWNYPFMLPLSPLVSAIAAGCVAIIKPSEFTPHTSALVRQILAKVFDEKEVAVIEGDHTVSQILLNLKFDHIHFTGSPAVGKIVMAAAAKHLTSVTLELGGKSPVLVDETANVNIAAARIAWGKFVNEGQTCIAPDYVFVHESKKDVLVNALREQIKKLYTDKPAESADLCRIINAKHFERVSSYLHEQGISDTQIACGGNTNPTENYIEPTLVLEPDNQSKLMTEEIFGPVLPIKTFKNVDDALGIINEKEKPLALYIFSSKQKNIDYILHNTTAGGTCINDVMLHIAQPNLPFGGVNNSGIGKSMGYYGFKEFSNERAIFRQHSPMSSIQLMYPPYKSKFKQFLIDFTMKYL